MGELLDCLRDKDEDAFHRWSKCEAWATVEQLMEANGIVSLQFVSCASCRVHNVQYQLCVMGLGVCGRKFPPRSKVYRISDTEI